MSNNTDKPQIVADAKHNNWVDRFAPNFAKPYLRLARADRPIGTWLLLWPCWWSIALAADKGSYPNWWFIALFALGAFTMRGAGCTLNDIADRKFDGLVERTRSRPIPSGQVSVLKAVIFMLFLSFIGLWVLTQFNTFAIFVGLASIPIIIIYPFMKRITYWPQLVLGLAFNWGALLGWAAIKGELSLPAYLLYIGGVFWTLGYDTIYAHQDKEDDALIGVKSTALKLGQHTKPWLLAFYTIAAVCFTAAGHEMRLSPIFLGAASLMTLHMVWQIVVLDLNDSVRCLRVFKSNSMIGWLLFAGIIAGKF
ncbi:MAG: 4-hydroxybenzoate octaprenyltransferase [Sphingomonadales bacterium]|nr:4-hydroxybenzoate octaprenyltransferase [Sphingomonadales bacterium]